MRASPVVRVCRMCALKGIVKSKHSRRVLPTSRLRKAFAWGDLYGVRSTTTPNDSEIEMIGLSLRFILETSCVRKRTLTLKPDVLAALAEQALSENTTVDDLLDEAARRLLE